MNTTRAQTTLEEETLAGILETESGEGEKNSYSLRNTQLYCFLAILDFKNEQHFLCKNNYIL